MGSVQRSLACVKKTQIVQGATRVCLVSALTSATRNASEMISVLTGSSVSQASANDQKMDPIPADKVFFGRRNVLDHQER